MIIIKNLASFFDKLKKYSFFKFEFEFELIIIWFLWYNVKYKEIMKVYQLFSIELLGIIDILLVDAIELSLFK
jgi:hypothetical protein